MNELLQPLMAVSAPRQKNWRASFSTDGKLKMWVYGVAAGAFVLLIFIVSMIYLAWWVDEFIYPDCHHPHHDTKVFTLIHFELKLPFPSCRPATVTSPFFVCLIIISVFCFLHATLCVRAAAPVPRCIALLRPKSLTPMGRHSGWAKMHMRWFTPVPIAKSTLKAANGRMWRVHLPSKHPPV